ncbi:aminotransferase class V-fold PLP-dependent enzyme [Solitalea canadensis]|uniref:Selenocysteine lyase n=1 Tax=Solitalea canadensis (strain ATCC 29591 / DSM 3403 / JCM 21819 / LMG 8368 / NBRC 15130 / NCIMB 12057 / USAM 9D) TaxID=929556 RepID=H8KVV1_SOLCM|nr:aminotransferase class V-fold PLP-dependent enzyme [Solitalea canadensis]AFD06724.1 selenocysteine lyase [Solitalea canadensis DSM 3403]
MKRSNFLKLTGLALGASAFPPVFAFDTEKAKKISFASWSDIRQQFLLESGKVHMSQMLLATNPTEVREAIDHHRKMLNENPVEYWENNWIAMEQKMREAAARYINSSVDEVALTGSTTMGLGILYTGLKLKAGDEVLMTTHDHFSTERSIEYAVEKNKATVRKVVLYEDPATAKADEMVDILIKAIKPETRVIAVTWVHSCTGMKLPIKKFSAAIKAVNASRSPEKRIYFCVDGVHGFGVENIDIKDMGCDFFTAACHKWIFGPRGTGILFGKKDAWDMMVPTIPSFDKVYAEWLGLIPKDQLTFGDIFNMGGFHSFENRWALDKAFEFHFKVGKGNIEERTHELNTMLKQGLKEIKHIKLYTPVSSELSCGINCFDVDGLKPDEVVKRLHSKNIIATSSPYRISYARLTPSIINTEEEVKRCISELERIKT